jgi:hypothetical protein
MSVRERLFNGIRDIMLAQSTKNCSAMPVMNYYALSVKCV